MLDLSISILCSTLIFVVFKLFSIYKVQTFNAIIVNYIVASGTGLLLFPPQIGFIEIFQKDWIWGPLSLGVLFIIIFNLMGITSQRAGISVASVATKMAFIIPVIIGVFVYHEHLSFVEVLGVLMAIAAVYFASVKKSNSQVSSNVLILPLLVFLGSGLIDSAMKFFQEKKLEPHEFSLFSSLIFVAAASTGFVFLMIKPKQKPLKTSYKNVIGGIALGVPNYFSIYFLLRALNSESYNSASIFTINNVAIVMLSTLAGILFFREKMTAKNWGGIVLAILSIILVV